MRNRSTAVPANLIDAAPPPWEQAAPAVAAGLGVDPLAGLSPEEAQRRLLQHGPNRLGGPDGPSWLRRLLRPFANLMVLVLLAAAGIAVALGEAVDAGVILAIVLLNVGVDALQSWRADRALQALRRLAAPSATVRRGGRTVAVEALALVPGDIVLLEAGDRVPADLRLLEVRQLRLDESALTGESVTVDKTDAALPAPASGGHTPAADRLNTAHLGTLVTEGRATGVVVATGAATELGGIADLVSGTAERDSPLQQRLASLGRALAAVVLVVCGAVFWLGLARGEPIGPMALTALSLAVAAIPEALPAVLTVLLALGARRMAQRQALVRRLSAVETLGAVDTICADKTGTLTINRMSVACALTRPEAPADPAVIDSGPAALAGADDGAAAVDTTSRITQVALWRAALLCNDAQAHAPAVGGDGLPWRGDPTETALLEGAQAFGLHVLRWRGRLPRQHEWPFDPQRKRMSTLHRSATGWLLACKGAPETVLPRCRWFQQARDDERGSRRAAWQARADALAAQGLRVLAVAQRRWPELGADPAHPLTLSADAVEQDLELLGLIGLVDPPRAEAAAAVAHCRGGGIVPVMITGDHPATAVAIARELGILGPDEAPHEARVLTGAALAALDEAALADVLEPIRVYARVDPAQKIRIVQALQARGHVVAMTGDGVNDAPALKAADIGVAMGRGGTDVAREAADLVLLDDHLATVVAAVREGRRIIDNLRKFLRYVLTGNTGEIGTLALAPLLGLGLPLAPTQILWINLVTDGLPGIALAGEPAEPGVMRRPPRPASASLLGDGLWQHALLVGLLIAGLCVGLQAWSVAAGRPDAQTLVFTALTLCQLGHVLAIRAEREPLWRLSPASNPRLYAAVGLSVLLQAAVVYLPPLQAVFGTRGLALDELALAAGAALVVVATVELEKTLRRRAAQPADGSAAAASAA